MRKKQAYLSTFSLLVLTDLFSMNALDLYHWASGQCSQSLTQAYSTSFTLGIRNLSPRLQAPIYNLYGYVRLADEIVDSFHTYDKAALLNQLERDTYDALEKGISLNPILHAFVQTVYTYRIPLSLIKAFLASMERDLTQTHYHMSEYQQYIYGSAEAVGLMCLKVFCEEDESRYESLLEPARRLGAAFQKVNFLRDMASDYQERGRVYFPGVDFTRFDYQAKSAIEADIEADFQAAYAGIWGLPKGARPGVYLAYQYYYQLFRKIRSTPPAQLQTARIRLSDGFKWLLWGKSLFELSWRRQ